MHQHDQTVTLQYSDKLIKAYFTDTVIMLMIIRYNQTLIACENSGNGLDAQV